MSARLLRFENDRGHTLAARLDVPPDNEPIAYALLAHCFTCSKDLRGLRTLSRALTSVGYAVLRFDFSGLGESEGAFPETNFSSSVDDLVAAARFLEAEYEAPTLLVGHSFGGAAVLRAAEHIESARAVATIGAPADPRHVQQHLKGSLDEIRTRGSAEVEIAGRSFRIQQQFLEDIQEQSIKRSLHTLDRPLLVLHAPRDEVVGIENARRIFEMARHPKSFVSLDEADHLLTSDTDATYAGAVLGAWARRYAAPKQEERKQGAPDDNRITARTRAGGLRTELLANGHALVADEPATVEGGTNAGPTPYDYLAAALAACTSMTLRMYADHKGWPLEEAVVRVRHRKIHAEDCAHCETKGGKLDRFERTVELTGELTEPQRERLLEIANRCPVHRTFRSEIDIPTALGAR